MTVGDGSLPAGSDVNDDVTRCAVLTHVQEEANIQLQEIGNKWATSNSYQFPYTSLMRTDCCRVISWTVDDFFFPLYSFTLSVDTFGSLFLFFHLYWIVFNCAYSKITFYMLKEIPSQHCCSFSEGNSYFNIIFHNICLKSNQDGGNTATNLLMRQKHQ